MISKQFQNNFETKFIEIILLHQIKFRKIVIKSSGDFYQRQFKNHDQPDTIFLHESGKR